MNKKKFIYFSRSDLGQNEIKSLTKTINSGWLTEGPQNKIFEKNLKRFLGCQYITLTSNATSALDIAIKILNLKKDDEIITPSLTWASAANMIELNNCKVVFVDIDPDTLNLCYDDLKKKINKNTKAIIPVHFAGRDYQIKKLKKIINNKKIKIIEDCSHAIGTFNKNKHVGLDSDFSVFSFHPNKNITTGEGGALISKKKRDFIYANKIKYLGLNKVTFNNNTKKKFTNKEVEFPSRKMIMSDLHASIGVAQLKRLNIFLKKRKLISKSYYNGLKNLKNIKPLIFPKSYIGHSWHLFIIKFNFKKSKNTISDVIQYFNKNNIGTGIHYYPLHFHKYYKKKKILGSLKNTNLLKNKILSLPLHTQINKNDIKRVISVLKFVDSKIQNSEKIS